MFKKDKSACDPGISQLSELLARAKPQLHEDLFVFVSIPNAHLEDVVELCPIAAFYEAEGLSLVLERNLARARELQYEGEFRLISLQVHSSLNAVGLTAILSTALAQAGIAANVVAACYHDHVFVPADRAEEALAILEQMK